MNNTLLTKTLSGLGLAALLAGSAWGADCRQKIALSPTNAGVAADISGTAEKRGRSGQERFKLSMDARVADGTTYIVWANGSPVGTLTIALGDGELEINNNNGKTLPAGANPACSIGAVRVTDAAGMTVLNGSF